MSYVKQQITSSGLNLDNTTPAGQVYDVLAYTTASVTLLGNVVINPTIAVGFDTEFTLRWEANLTLSTFSVVIAGVTLAQDQVNQTGTFSCYYDGTVWSVQYFADGKDQPQAAQGVTDIPVPSVGGGLLLTAGVDAAYQRLTGPVTLLANYAVSANVTGIKAGSQFQIEIAGGITLGANTLTVFGISINANQALNGGVIILATFDGVSSWVAASTSKPITTADIDPVTALSVMGNATNVSAAPSNITFPTDFGVLQRNGTTLTTGLLTASNFDTTSVLATQVAIVSLTSAQIKNSNTAPIKILDSPGVGRANIISSILVSCTFISVAYTVNLDVNVYAVGGTAKLFTRDNLLGFTSSGIDQLYPYEVSTSEFQNAANSEIRFTTDVGNPLTGDGTITLRIIYQTINV
jgi:hypothetical protein